MDKETERLRIGHRIAEIRNEQHLTQRQLAERCGLQQCHIARIETGRYSVGLDTLAAIAEALGKTVDLTD
ncbi:MAG: helix-turn-helix domain-containing protein [Alloprevotella sp.]